MHRLGVGLECKYSSGSVTGAIIPALRINQGPADWTGELFKGNGRERVNIILFVRVEIDLLTL